MLETLRQSTRSTRSSKPPYTRSDPTAWADYVEVARDYDERMLNSLNRSFDVVLVFAGLFTAIVANFLLDAKKDLQEDYAETTVQLLRVLIDPSLSPPPPFQRPPGSAVALGIEWYLSLLLSISASIVAMASKAWLFAFEGDPPVADLGVACSRQKRFDAFKNCRVASCISVCYTLVLLSIVLFLTGLMTGWPYSYLVPVSITFCIILGFFFLTWMQIYGVIFYGSTPRPIFKAWLFSSAAFVRRWIKTFNSAVGRILSRGSWTGDRKETVWKELTPWHADISPEVQVKALSWLIQRRIGPEKLLRALSHIRDLCHRQGYISFIATHVTQPLITYLHSVVSDGIITEAERKGVVLSMFITAHIRSFRFSELQEADPIPPKDTKLKETIDGVFELDSSLLAQPGACAASLWMLPWDSGRAYFVVDHINRILQSCDNSSDSTLLDLFQSLQYSSYITRRHYSDVLPPGLSCLDIHQTNANAPSENVIRFMLMYSLDILSGVRPPRQWSEGSESVPLPDLIAELLQAIDVYPSQETQPKDHRELFVLSWLSSLSLLLRCKLPDQEWTEQRLVNLVARKLKNIPCQPMNWPSAVFSVLPLSSVAALHNNVRLIGSTNDRNSIAYEERPFLHAYAATVEHWFVNKSVLLDEAAFEDISRSIHLVLPCIEKSTSTQRLLAVYSVSLITALFPGRLDELFGGRDIRNALFKILTHDDREVEQEALNIKVYAALALSKLGVKDLTKEVCEDMQDVILKLVDILMSGDDRTLGWTAGYILSIMSREVWSGGRISSFKGTVVKSDSGTPHDKQTACPNGITCEHCMDPVMDSKGVFQWHDGFPLLVELYAPTLSQDSG